MTKIMKMIKIKNMIKTNKIKRQRDQMKLMRKSERNSKLEICKDESSKEKIVNLLN